MDANLKTKLDILEKRITLLEAYSNFLEKYGYMDIDWRSEEPYAVDEFLKELKKDEDKSKKTSTG